MRVLLMALCCLAIIGCSAQFAERNIHKDKAKVNAEGRRESLPKKKVASKDPQIVFCNTNPRTLTIGDFTEEVMITNTPIGAVVTFHYISPASTTHPESFELGRMDIERDGIWEVRLHLPHTTLPNGYLMAIMTQRGHMVTQAVVGAQLKK